MKNTLLLIFSTLISFAVAEIITSLFFKWNKTQKGIISDKVLMYSSPSFKASENESVKYVPNVMIRSLAIYGNKIEYDITKKTNNLGFYDDIPYERSGPQVKDIVFVGDSFTAGVGGEKNWLGQVRNTLNQSNVKVYNLGVAATGIHQFFNQLKVFEKKIPFDEVNIMVISHDFFRKIWYPYESAGNIWFCYKDLSCPHSPFPIIYKAEHTDSHESLIKQTTQIYQQKHKKLKFYQKMGLYKLYKLYFYKKREDSKNIMYTESLNKLKMMFNTFPNAKFRLFHIPEKQEVHANQYSINIEQDMQNIGIEYIPLLTQCSWSKNMYHKLDAHPNDIGYANLAKCITQIMHQYIK